MSTILIIDDNKDYRDGLSELLNLEGYMTLEAKNGLAALQIIRENLPDLILCDVDMPVMDGIELLQHMKNDSKFSMIPFLVLSGGRDESAVQIGKDLKMGTYLTKGITISDLLSKIDHFLNLVIAP